MTPAAKLTQMIEELLPEDQEKVEEYVALLRAKESVLLQSESEFDVQYRSYILRGIREGEEAVARGEVYDSAEARKRLLDLLNQ